MKNADLIIIIIIIINIILFFVILILINYSDFLLRDGIKISFFSW
jgi:hypothetical protein